MNKISHPQILLDSHYKYLKKKNKSKKISYYKRCLFYKITLEESYDDFKLKAETVTLMCKFFKKNFKNLVLGKLQQLLRIEHDFYTEIASSESKTTTDIHILIDSKLTELFGYTSFSKSDVAWNAFEYCKILGLNVCPYCNLHFIYSISDEKKRRLRPHLDHFFPKSRHPILSMSIFNLIPSCYSCNSSLKGDKEPDDILSWYPFENNVSEKFKITRDIYAETNSETKIDYYARIMSDSSEYGLKFDPVYGTTRESLETYCEFFFLKNRYEMHKVTVTRELKKFFYYSDSYLQSLDDAYKIKVSKQQLFKLFYFNNYQENVLSKLLNDILLDEQRYLY